MTVDERRARLIGWLEAIRTDVQDLALDHHVFWEIQAIIKANPKFASASNLVNQWMASSFVKSAAVGVRRHVKTGDDSISLKRLLTEVKQHPELVSREFYLAFFADGLEWLRETNGNEYFDSLSGAGGQHIMPDVVEKQLLQLEAAANSIEHYVDRRVAHYDTRGLAKPLPTFKDLEGALRTLEEQVIFYWTLLTGASLIELTP